MVTDAEWPDKTPRELKKWTVMVYMVAGNDAELDAVAVKDLREMERGVGSKPDDSKDLHVVAQINRAWPDTPQRYEVRRSAHSKRVESVLCDVDVQTDNMGEGATLERFLKWAPAKFPAEHYLLVLWGHGYGLGFGRDHGDPLTLNELTAALKTFRETRAQLGYAGSDSPLDLLGANSCAMCYVEAAYELRNSVDFMVASQIAVPLAGWPYESILRRIEAGTTGESLGKLIVDSYVGQYNTAGRDRVTMTLLDLRTLRDGSGEGFNKLVRRFADKISEEVRLGGPFGSDRLAQIRDVFIAAAAGDVRPLIDLHDLCTDLRDARLDPLNPVIATILESLDRLVAHHAGHPDLDDLNGVGIFAPFVTDERDLERLELQDDSQGSTSATGSKRVLGRDAYEQLQIFGEERVWPRLVYDELRQEIPAELMSSLSGVATGRRDRRDITQIVLGIDSSFNKLDRALANAKESLHGDLGISAPGANARSMDQKRFGLPFWKLGSPNRRTTDVRSPNPVDSSIAAARAVVKKDAAGAIGSSVDSGVTLVTIAAPEVVAKIVDLFTNVENLIGDIERAVRKGMTNASFGLGPTALGDFDAGVGETPKPAHGPGGEPPKPAHGPGGEPPKPAHGGIVFEVGTSSQPSLGADLRVDLAMARVADLFRQVGDALKGLEQAASSGETTAAAVLSGPQGQTLGREDLLAAAAEITQALSILEDASRSARRTVRRVLSHPMYGLGPSSGTMGFEGREALASAGGLDARNLRLLSRLPDASRPIRRN